MKGIHWSPIISPHKGPVIWKAFPLYDINWHGVVSFSPRHINGFDQHCSIFHCQFNGDITVLNSHSYHIESSDSPQTHNHSSVAWSRAWQGDQETAERRVPYTPRHLPPLWHATLVTPLWVPIYTARSRSRSRSWAEWIYEVVLFTKVYNSYFTQWFLHKQHTVG